MKEYIIEANDYNKEFILIEISKDMSDFDNTFPGMLSFKRNTLVNNEIHSIHLSNDISYKNKVIIGKLSELTEDQAKDLLLPNVEENFISILLNILFENKIPLTKKDYLILKVIPNIPGGWLDWNTLTMEQIVQYLKNKYKYSSSGESLAIYKLIQYYKEHEKRK